VKGSGCVALGHPANLAEVPSARNGSPRKMTGARRMWLSIGSGTICCWNHAFRQTWCRRRRKAADALWDEDSRDLARNARSSGKQSRRNKYRAMPSATERNCGRALRCRLIAVWSSCSRRKLRFDTESTAAFMRRSPVYGPLPLVALAVSDPSLSPTIELALAFLADAARKRAGPALMRLANGQQNAYRRDPSGGDPGGCLARQSRRRIRF